MTHFYKLLLARPVVGIQILIASLFVNLFTLSSALYVMQVYSHYLIHGIDGTLITLTLGMILALGMDASLREARYRLALALVAGPDRQLGDGVAERLLWTRLEALMRLPPGESRMVLRDLDKVQSVYTPNNLLSMLDVPFAILMIMAVLAISPVLGLCVLVVIVVGLLIVIYESYRLHNTSLSLQDAQSTQGVWQASSERMETVRITTAESYLLKQWRQQHGQLRLFRAQAERQQAHLQYLMQDLSLLLSMVVVAVGAKLTILDNLNFGLLMGANMMAMRILSTTFRPATILNLLVQGAQHRERLEAFLALPMETSQGGTTLPQYEGRLEFLDLTFSYPGSTGPLYEHVNVTVQGGQILVVTGGNGTGKTTLARLITGLLTPERGAILADGVDIRQFDAAWWRRQLVYLPQEPFFLDAPLRDNLTTLDENLDDEALTELLKQVGLGPFLAHSKEGLNMSVRDGGRTFSPGIRRRLALARALATKGRLVIIDEPAEGLDQPGAAVVNQVLNAMLAEGRTLVVMTHNPGGLRAAGPVLDLNHKPVPRLLLPQEGTPS